MPKYVLAFNGEPIRTFEFGGSNAESLERDEFEALKRLGRTSHFSFEITPKETLPPADRDPLDDIALDIVNSGGYAAFGIKEQAQRRVQERGLCK